MFCAYDTWKVVEDTCCVSCGRSMISRCGEEQETVVCESCTSDRDLKAGSYYSYVLQKRALESQK